MRLEYSGGITYQEHGQGNDLASGGYGSYFRCCVGDYGQSQRFSRYRAIGHGIEGWRVLCS